MSTFYEVRRRDGAARLGLLSLQEGRQQTPLLFHGDSLRSGEEGFAVRSVEAADFAALCQKEDWNAPRGAVLLPSVHPLFSKLNEAISSLNVDCYALSYASALLHSPREFVRGIVAAREAIPPDTALWVPGIATAENVAVLIYTGVDLVDDTSAVIQGYQGRYHTEEGALELADLEELPCVCSVCSSITADELRERDDKERGQLLAQHNALLLEQELKKVRTHIRAGTMREYIELKARSSPFLTAVLRLLDLEQEAYLEPRTPIARNCVLMANTLESLWRIEVKRFAHRVLDRYEPPQRRVLLLLPCSARKPYSRSPSHRKFIDAIAPYRGHIHEMILTSPLGVVPRELEVVYPAAFYDIPVTGHWDAEERAWVASCLRNYLMLHSTRYEHIVAHLSGPYRDICLSVAADSGLEMISTCDADEDMTASSTLQRLRKKLTELCGDTKRLSGFEQKASMLRAMADYQFGRGVGPALFTEAGGTRLKITGKFPTYQLSSDGTVLARVVPAYGLLTLTINGARRIADLMAAYTVHIGDFLPRGSILAPGVLDASVAIRVNDEVLISGEKAFGVGRAKMAGWEMVASRRGVAVEVREITALNPV
ncbi:MAG: archaeosine synthase subunit alpha [Candidatus Methanospirareceae archaeon]